MPCNRFLDVLPVGRVLGYWATFSRLLSKLTEFSSLLSVARSYDISESLYIS